MSPPSPSPVPSIRTASTAAPAASEPASANGLWLALGVGAALRLLAVLLSDPTPGDDAGRLMAACDWAVHPVWIGLSGIWSPLHTYLLGGPIHLFGHPLFWARLIGWLSTTAAIPALWSAARAAGLSARAAGFAALLLAIYYVHVWMAGTAYVEGPYTLAFLIAVGCALRAGSRPAGPARDADALGAGVAMAVALLLRHEAKPVWAAVLVWLALNSGRSATLRYALPSVVALAWQLVEPSLRGGSFAGEMHMVAQMKLDEMALHGSRIEALKRWIVMPAGSPSFVVVLLGLAGMWLARRAWRRDLFAWLFVAQVALYLGLTIYPGWQPYLRYLLLYVVCLLPAAGVALEALARRAAWAPALVVVLALAIQGGAWWKGRNESRPLGWLPVYRAATPQSVLTGWMRARAGGRRALMLEGYPQAWDMNVALIESGKWRESLRFRAVSYDDQQRLEHGGTVPLGDASVLVVDPTARSAPRLLAEVPRGAPVEVDTPRLRVVALDAARSAR